MMIFLDTSAIFAYFDRASEQHAAVLAAWDIVESNEDTLVATNYLVVESTALLQARLGIDAVRGFATGIVPILSVEWVEPEVHDAALTAVLAANRRDLSFVDCVSFEVMRRLSIRRAFTLDGHFREQGFECVPQADL